MRQKNLDINVQEVIVESVNSLWQLTNNLVEVYPRFDLYTVSIFGSARVVQDSELYQEVREFAKQVALLECNIVTGGGYGIMEAANRGAFDAKLVDDIIQSIGLKIELPFEQMPNSYLDKIWHHKTFFSRLQHFSAISDSFVAFYGGIGTVLEILMILQMLQVKKIDNHKLILVGDMWPAMLEWFREYMLKDDMKLIHDGDLLIPTLVSNGSQALEVIEQHRCEILGIF